jgi:hypothetical protein
MGGAGLTLALVSPESPLPGDARPLGECTHKELFPRIETTRRGDSRS